MSRQAKKKEINRYRILIGKVRVESMKNFEECFLLRRENLILKKEIARLEKENEQLKNKGLLSRIFG